MTNHDLLTINGEHRVAQCLTQGLFGGENLIDMIHITQAHEIKAGGAIGERDSPFHVHRSEFFARPGNLVFLGCQDK